jgi:hypothetical protein
VRDNGCALTVSSRVHSKRTKSEHKQGRRGDPSLAFFIHAGKGSGQMSHFHFEIKSGNKDTTMDHLAYILRRGSHAERGDLVAVAHGNMPTWASSEPELFWKASAKGERKNGSPFRDVTISLPNALTHDQNVELSVALAHVLAGPKPYQLALHCPMSSLQGELNPHAHFMVSDRIPDGIERAPAQISRRYNSRHPELGGCKKDSGGLNRMQLRDKVLAQRKVVADTINAALAQHGHAVRVDHRSLREQGKRRMPERYLGPAQIRSMSENEKRQYIAERRDGRATDQQRSGR